MVMSMISLSTYPDGIFHGMTRFILYSMVPVGIAVYHPVQMIMRVQLSGLLLVIGYAAAILAAAVFLFYRGLRRYSSGNLMEALMKSDKSFIYCPNPYVIIIIKTNKHKENKK